MVRMKIRPWVYYPGKGTKSTLGVTEVLQVSCAAAVATEHTPVKTH